MYAMPGRMGHESMIKVNVSYPPVWCSQNKATVEPRRSSGCSLHHTVPNLLIVFEQWKVLWELVWKSSAKMCICLGHLGNEVLGVKLPADCLVAPGYFGVDLHLCKGYLAPVQRAPCENLGTSEGIQGNEEECFKKPTAVSP